MRQLKKWSSWTLVAALAGAATLLSGCGERSRSEAPFQVTNVASPAAPGSMSPHLAVTPDGKALMSWVEPAPDDAHAVRYSILEVAGWSEPRTVAASGGWFVNWADFPSVVPLTPEQWVAHWLVKRAGGTYAYDIALSVSDDGGIEWATPLTPHTDDTPTEHGFVSVFPWSGNIGAVWLDGRKMPPDTGEAGTADEAGKFGGMTLRFARLGDDGTILEDGEIDDLVCDCCQTDVAMAAAGPVVAYRDRSAVEIRDISVARYRDGGWSAPLTISDDQWLIPACPVNGPTIAADGQTVIVAWYAAPQRDSRIKVAWSQDAGRTFSAPLLIDADSVSGRVDVALLASDTAAVSWVGKTVDGRAQLRMRRVTMAGDQGPIQVVAEGEYSRSAGFPQMVNTGDRLVFAWPEPGEPRQVLTAFSMLSDG